MTVRIYRSTDFGAPQLSGQVGTLISVLDACLVNGYGSNTITSLTQSGGLATATTNVPHQYTNKPKVLIQGAGAGEYNGEVTVTPTGPSTFTFPIAPSAPASAGGTPTCKRAGSGWTKPFADGTYVAAYKQPAGSNGFYMRIDDNSTANVARMLGYETMTDVSTGSTPFPTTAQLTGGTHVMKSDVISAVARPWVLACNGPIMYLFISVDNNAAWVNANGYAFGDIRSYKAGGSDAYGTVIIGNNAASMSNNQFQATSNSVATITSGHWMTRSYTGIGSALAVGKSSDYAKAQSATTLGSNGIPYPSAVDGGLYVAPIWIHEISPTLAPRGELPGAWNPLHARPLATGDVWAPASGPLIGKIFEAVNLYSASQVLIETSDTW